MSDLSAPKFDSDGAPTGRVALNQTVFGVTPNRAVMHQVVVAHLASRRSATAHTKTRAEVRGGGRKPWRQKGLGRARHGSIRSPIWVGGGVAHGPRDNNYVQRTPKKMKALALRGALSARASEGAVNVIGSFDWGAPSTKKAALLLSEIGADRRVLLVLDRSEEIALRSFRNIPRVTTGRPGLLNAYEVLRADDVIFSELALVNTDGVAGTGLRHAEMSEQDFVKETEDLAPIELGAEGS